MLNKFEEGRAKVLDQMVMQTTPFNKAFSDPNSWARKQYAIYKEELELAEKELELAKEKAERERQER